MEYRVRGEVLPHAVRRLVAGVGAVHVAVADQVERDAPVAALAGELGQLIAGGLAAASAAAALLVGVVVVLQPVVPGAVELAVAPPRRGDAAPRVAALELLDGVARVAVSESALARGGAEFRVLVAPVVAVLVSVTSPQRRYAPGSGYMVYCILSLGRGF